MSPRPLTLHGVRVIVHVQVRKVATVGAGRLSDAVTLGELALDSLDVVELQTLIEMEFEHGRSFWFDAVKDDWSDSTTVGDIVQRTAKYVGVS